jgi:hypothetical protein
MHRIMERVVETGDRAGAVAEGWVFGHVLHALAVDPHLAVVSETVEILGAGERPSLRERRFCRCGLHRIPSFASSAGN